MLQNLEMKMKISRLRFFTYILLHWLKSAQVIKRCIFIMTILICLMVMVYLNVYLTDWNNKFMQSLSDYAYDDFIYQVKVFFPIMIFYISLSALQRYLIAHIGFEWRKSIFTLMNDQWLNNMHYYKINLNDQEIDNPDQRFTQDISLVTTDAINLILLFIEKCSSLFIFSIRLWNYSNILKITLFNSSFIIPGLLLWLALIYCSIGTLLAYLLGYNIVALTVTQEKCEASLRYQLILLIENAQSIAMNRGEAYQQNIFKQGIHAIENNFYILLLNIVKLDAYRGMYQGINPFISIVMVGPFYFKKLINFGTLMQVNNIFSHVNDALSQLVFNFRNIFTLIAALTRLTDFHNCMNHPSRTLQIATSLSCHNLELHDQHNNSLASIHDCIFTYGDKILITGSSGSGK